MDQNWAKSARDQRDCSAARQAPEICLGFDTENPANKITHRFWLQQYSCLQQDNSASSIQPSPTRDRPSLLSRLARTLGMSSGSLAGEPGAQRAGASGSSPKSPSRKLAQHSTGSGWLGSKFRKKSPKSSKRDEFKDTRRQLSSSWFIKSLSSSTSVLLTPLNAGPTRTTRSQSAAGKEAPPRSDTLERTTGKLASPYRRVAQALRRRKRSRSVVQVASPTRAGPSAPATPSSDKRAGGLLANVLATPLFRRRKCPADGPSSDAHYQREKLDERGQKREAPPAMGPSTGSSKRTPRGSRDGTAESYEQNAMVALQLECKLGAEHDSFQKLELEHGTQKQPLPGREVIELEKSTTLAQYHDRLQQSAGEQSSWDEFKFLTKKLEENEHYYANETTGLTREQRNSPQMDIELGRFKGERQSDGELSLEQIHQHHQQQENSDGPLSNQRQRGCLTTSAKTSSKAATSSSLSTAHTTTIRQADDCCLPQSSSEQEYDTRGVGHRDKEDDDNKHQHDKLTERAARDESFRCQLDELVRPLASSDSSFGSSAIIRQLLNSTTELAAVRASTQESQERASSAQPAGGTAKLSSDSSQNLRCPNEPLKTVTSLTNVQSCGTKIKVDLTPPSGVGMITKNFRKLVKRQQSVDSYRMARDLKNKQRRQQEREHKHQSNEAIKGSDTPADMQLAAKERKYSMRVAPESEVLTVSVDGRNQPMRICIDPYAKPGSFTLPGQDRIECAISLANQNNDSDNSPKSEESPSEGSKRTNKPVPPNSLALLSSHQPYIVGTFSGSITPTYPTHHLPSPKYVSPNAASIQKKYSNASTISSSNSFQAYSRSNNLSGPDSMAPVSAGATSTNQSDTESSLACSIKGMMAPTLKSKITVATNPPSEFSTGSKNRSSMMSATLSEHLLPQISLPVSPAGQEEKEAEAAAAAALRAQMAEHIYDNKCGLGEDMKFLASSPELCDITFLVGDTREPVCAVKSVLAARSRVFHKILFGNRVARRFTRQSQIQTPGQLYEHGEESSDQRDNTRRDSSPKFAHRMLANKSSSPALARTVSGSPNQHQWSVTLDSSGVGFNSSPSPSGSAQPDAEPGSSASRAGRLSMGRDSTSQASQGSLEPLIIGPGQMAAPAKRTKKRSIWDGSHHGGRRLSRMFLKRASDPSIKHSSSSHHTNYANNQSYLDKMSCSQMSTTMIIEEFEPDVFRQLIEYIHTGCVLLQARTLLGLLNAADYYGLEQLRRACLRFVSCCITVDTVCSLLSTAERYIQYKCTKSIVQKVLEFVDSHADEIFKLNAFGLLPEHVVRLILARDGLKADESVKYNCVYTWCEYHCRKYELTNISDVMSNFLDLIQFHKIPTSVLLQEIYPTHIVPDDIFLGALAYQADPQNFETQPNRVRRMTLPNPTLHKEPEAEQRALRPNRSTRASQPDEPEDARLRSNKSTESGKRMKLRKGSIAQVSISNVMKLSHKLSIRKRQSNLPSEARRRASGVSSTSIARRPVSKQQSSVDKDPMLVGQQILNAFLLERERQRAIELEAAREEDAKRRVERCDEQPPGPGFSQAAIDKNQQLMNKSNREQPLNKSLSTRKSFKDFKHISRRIFMRHSSSKTLTTSQQTIDKELSSGKQDQKQDRDKRRNLFKFKRSETVFEASNFSSSSPFQFNKQ